MNNKQTHTEIIRNYHKKSMHSANRFAPGPPYLDWSTQPNPFRFYEGAKQIPLQIAADNLKTVHGDLYRKRTAHPLDFTAISVLFELSLGLSAWKSYDGESWALRCNPSSGNLHPTEGYLIVPDINRPSTSSESEPIGGVYHYVSPDHCLEERFRPEKIQRQQWNSAFPGTSFLIGLTSIHWREAWKYGLRALRYCELDTGHAAMAFRYGAAALGWQVRVLSAPGDEDISQLLGLTPCRAEIPEPEHPDLLLAVTIDDAENQSNMMPCIDSLLLLTKNGLWHGKPNPLSPDHMLHWPEIDTGANACCKPRVIESCPEVVSLSAFAIHSSKLKAATLIRQRRSAQAFDGTTALSLPAFFQILAACLPRQNQPPWDLMPFKPAIHPILMVHRVVGLKPGLYGLPRRDGILETLKKECDKTFLWSRVPEAPIYLPFYLLQEGNFQREAQAISCGQEIAADGVFSLGMIAEYAAGLEIGPWGYRQLFWEAGMLGQTLYLEAESRGVRGTGIGCFFDDGFHSLLGLKDDLFQSLYHFTVGCPVTDMRLQTHPPYAHLGAREA